MPSEISCFSLLMLSTMHFDLVVDLNQFVRMADALGPAHFADVHQPFDALFELDERTVAHHVDDCRPCTADADRVLAPARVPTGWRVFCFKPRAIFSFS